MALRTKDKEILVSKDKIEILIIKEKEEILVIKEKNQILVIKEKDKIEISEENIRGKIETKVINHKGKIENLVVKEKEKILIEKGQEITQKGIGNRLEMKAKAKENNSILMFVKKGIQVLSGLNVLDKEINNNQSLLITTKLRAWSQEVIEVWLELEGKKEKKKMKEG